MSYKYKLNFYDVKGLTLFPRVLTDFISSVITAMVPEESDKINDFVLYIDLYMDKAIIKSGNDFRDDISKFEINGLDYEYYEDTDDGEEEENEEESMYTLDISSLTSNKLRVIVIQDLIESVKHLLHKDKEDYYNYDPFLNSIKFDMLNSKITLKSYGSLYDFMKHFNNNVLSYRYESTLGYEVKKWETYLN
jgi:hypothetical protein